MAARPIWSGFLKLSLVTVPVRAYTATDSGGEVHLNQLHAVCMSRIQYKKTCPIHGEVAEDQIVSGQEYEKGKYVTIQPEELDKLRTPADKMVSIDAFVSPDTIDPIYLFYYPEGAVGGHPFNLLREGMVSENKYAVAKVVMQPAGDVRPGLQPPPGKSRFRGDQSSLASECREMLRL
jgi:DNA end-binding protein Ku